MSRDKTRNNRSIVEHGFQYKLRMTFPSEMFVIIRTEILSLVAHIELETMNPNARALQAEPNFNHEENYRRGATLNMRADLRSFSTFTKTQPSREQSVSDVCHSIRIPLNSTKQTFYLSDDVVASAEGDSDKDCLHLHRFTCHRTFTYLCPRKKTY